MSKIESDNLIKISTSFLNKHNYFKGNRSGTITWSNNYSKAENSVSIEVSSDKKYIRTSYIQQNKNTENKIKYDYKIPLTTTQCNYGGKRYWFKCPCIVNGTYCGKRIGVIYLVDKYFGCRECHNLTYSSKKISGIAKK